MEKLAAYLKDRFPDLSESEVQLLAQPMVARTLPQYQTLYRKAEPSNAFFVIDTGRVSLANEDAPPMLTATSSNCLGEQEFFRQEPRPVTARAESNVTYWEMQAADFLQVLADHPRIGLKIGNKIGQQQSAIIAQMTDYLLAKLGDVPSLSGLGHDILQQLARQFKPVELQTGDSLYRQGDASQGLYLVDAGVMVRTGEGLGRQELPANTLLGISTLFQDSRHDHTVEAAEDALCWALSRGDFARLNTMFPVLQRALQSEPLPSRLIPPATPEVVKLAEVLRGLPALRAVPSRTLETAAARFQSLAVKAGESVYRMGDDSDSFYLVLAGEIELTMSSEAGVNQELSRVTPGAECIFGLESLRSGAPRTKNATATVDTELRWMSREDLEELEMQHPELKPAWQSRAEEAPPAEASGADLGTLNMFDVFSGLSGADLARFPPVLQPATFYPQEQIYAQGDSLENLYLLQQGTVLIEREGESTPRYLHPGSTLGVAYVMSGSPSREHAFASSEVRVVVLPRDQTMQLARDIPRFMENLWKVTDFPASPAAPPAAPPADVSAPPSEPLAPLTPTPPVEAPVAEAPVPVPSDSPTPGGNPYAADTPPPQEEAVPPANPFTVSAPPPVPSSPPDAAPVPQPVMENDPFLMPGNANPRTDGMGNWSAGGKIRMLLLIVLLVWLVLALGLDLLEVDLASLLTDLIG